VQKIRLLSFTVILALAALSGGTSAQAAPEFVIDWSKGDAQATAASCGAFIFTNMRDHGSYSFWVRGTTSGTCSFRADGVTFLYPPNHGPMAAPVHSDAEIETVITSLGREPRGGLIVSPALLCSPASSGAFGAIGGQGLKCNRRRWAADRRVVWSGPGRGLA
jgi:hypothetical protein